MITSIRFLWVVFLTLLAGCTKEQISDPIQNVSGSYESSRFIEPGSAGGGVDIQSAGGYLRISLHATGDFVAQLYVPEHLDEWTQAVNAQGGFGRWRWAVARHPGEIRDLLLQGEEVRALAHHT